MILCLNIFVVFIPFLQFFVLRSSPFGEQPLWERILESFLAICGISSPFRRRASHSLDGRRQSTASKLNFSLISHGHYQNIASKQDRSRNSLRIRQMSLRSGQSFRSMSRRMSAAGLDDISRLRTRKSLDTEKAARRPSGELQQIMLLSLQQGNTPQEVDEAAGVRPGRPATHEHNPFAHTNGQSQPIIVGPPQLTYYRPEPSSLPDSLILSELPSLQSYTVAYEDRNWGYNTFPLPIFAFDQPPVANNWPNIGGSTE